MVVVCVLVLHTLGGVWHVYVLCCVCCVVCIRVCACARVVVVVLCSRVRRHVPHLVETVHVFAFFLVRHHRVAVEVCQLVRADRCEAVQRGQVRKVEEEEVADP